MILALAAALAIVVQDRAPLRAAPKSAATELTSLFQGDVLEIRGEQAGYLKVYNYRRERGGFLRSDLARPLSVAESDAPELLAILRFLRESRGSEALGISYGAAYLKAVPARALTAEPLAAIARMAERLADTASGSGNAADVGAHLEVVSQFGIRMQSFERNGRIQICYDGELFRRILALPQAGAEDRAIAALALTRPECIDPGLGLTARDALDRERSERLAGIADRELSPLTRSRLHARRAAVWATVAFEQARRGESAGLAGQRALSDLLAVQATELGEDRRTEYSDAAIHVGASRWAAQLTSKPGPLVSRAVAGSPGQTCVALRGPQAGGPSVVERCTYGIVWMASARVIGEGEAIVLSVQPLESWCELWIFHQRHGKWIVDVLPPGEAEPESGYIEYAGYAPPSRRILIVREIEEHGRFRRSFEELRLDDLVTVRYASRPDLLRDYDHWSDPAWRSATVALR